MLPFTQGRCPKVSVIVPNLNGLELLKICIPSLLKTDYPDFEIIVSDDGSDDGSVQFIREHFPGVQLVESGHTGGFGKACNAGVMKSRGELVAFMNNDIEVDPGWLSPLVAHLLEDQGLAGCDSKYVNYFRRELIDCAGRFLDRYGDSLDRGAGEPDRGQYDVVQPVSYGLALFRKDLIEKVGGFDEVFLVYYEDADLGWRLYRMGYRVDYVPASVVFHMHGMTTSQAKSGKKRLKSKYLFHFYKNRLRMIIKNQSGLELGFAMMICLYDMFALTMVYLATSNGECMLMMMKGLAWNLSNLGNTLISKRALNLKATPASMPFMPYSGTWKDLLRRLAG